MHIHLGRAARTLALGALLTLTAAGACVAQAGSARPETTLLGVTLLKSSYRDVLKKFGRPDEIQAGGPYMPTEGIPESLKGGNGSGSGFGGPSAGGGQTGSRTTSKTGFPGQGGSSPAGPAGAMGGPGGPGGGPGAAMYGGGTPYGGGGKMGLPGFPGSGGSPYGGGGGPSLGVNTGPGLPGGEGAAGPGAGGGAENGGDENQYEATWWYHDMKNGIHKSFLFNKDGRVIQIQEYGHDPHRKSSKTRRGVALGSTLNQVLRQYGWSNDGANNGSDLIMRYGGEEKVAFQLVHNVVVGITIAIVKETPTVEAPQ